MRFVILLITYRHLTNHHLFNTSTARLRKKKVGGGFIIISYIFARNISFIFSPMLMTFIIEGASNRGTVGSRLLWTHVSPQKPNGALLSSKHVRVGKWLLTRDPQAAPWGPTAWRLWTATGRCSAPHGSPTPPPSPTRRYPLFADRPPRADRTHVGRMEHSMHNRGWEVCTAPIADQPGGPYGTLGVREYSWGRWIRGDGARSFLLRKQWECSDPKPKPQFFLAPVFECLHFLSAGLNYSSLPQSCRVPPRKANGTLIFPTIPKCLHWDDSHCPFNRLNIPVMFCVIIMIYVSISSVEAYRPQICFFFLCRMYSGVLPLQFFCFIIFDDFVLSRCVCQQTPQDILAVLRRVAHEVGFDSDVPVIHWRSLCVPPFYPELPMQVSALHWRHKTSCFRGNEVTPLWCIPIFLAY